MYAVKDETNYGLVMSEAEACELYHMLPTKMKDFETGLPCIEVQVRNALWSAGIKDHMERENEWPLRATCIHTRKKR